MEYPKIKNLLSNIRDRISRFISKKWIEVHYQFSTAKDRYKPSKQIGFKKSMLRSDPYDIVGKGKIIVTNPDNNVYDPKLSFKNNAPFNSCVSNVKNTVIDSAEDLDIVMFMYNLIEYTKNYRKTAVSLWNYYRDEPNSGTEGNKNYSIQSFYYKTSIAWKLENNDVEKEELSIFFRSLNIPLINCEVPFNLMWSENCVLTRKATRSWS